jgi:hypothetical protein
LFIRRDTAVSSHSQFTDFPSNLEDMEENREEIVQSAEQLLMNISEEETRLF